ncbi:MAG: glycerol-3-phosphate dehydrogenase/oxidase [Acidobacteriota bacterium]
MLERLKDRRSPWDFVVIGGGATGLGTALEAASRGYQTLLLEQSDFGKGTSSRSTKLIHGGVRYLQQGNFSLVLEALRERGLLIRNAPHLVHHLSFVVPTYDWWEGPFYGLGLKLYDVLAGKLGLGPSTLLTREETLKRIPTLEPNGLRGGVVYFDGQFDDARLAINLAQTFADHEGTPLNYVRVTSVLKANQIVCGVTARDEESGNEFEVLARAVINATGVFADSIRQMDEEGCSRVVSPSQGVHLVLDRSFQPSASAIMVPHTDDGRVLFAVPWHNRVVVGTTDTAVSEPTLEPRPLQEEIDFLLTHAARYLTQDPTPADVLSVFAGLRPLVAKQSGTNTAALSRDHTLLISTSGLVTVTGGKWTTYRKMGQDTIDQAVMVAGLDERPSVTQHLKLHGWTHPGEAPDIFQVYGSDSSAVKSLAVQAGYPANSLHPALPYHVGQVIWAVRREMARTVEDVLSRRTRALLLDAHASVEAAPLVAQVMARELARDQLWCDRQVAAYRDLAKNYMLH